MSHYVCFCIWRGLQSRSLLLRLHFPITRYDLQFLPSLGRTGVRLITPGKLTIGSYTWPDQSQGFRLHPNIASLWDSKSLEKSSDSKE